MLCIWNKVLRFGVSCSLAYLRSPRGFARTLERPEPGLPSASGTLEGREPADSLVWVVLTERLNGRRASWYRARYVTPLHTSVGREMLPESCPVWKGWTYV